MSVSYALRRLAEIIDDVEADGVEVRDLSLPPDRTAVADDTVRLTLDVAVSLDDNGSAEADISETGEPEGDGESEQPVITGVVDDPADSDDSPSQPAQDQATANGERPPEEPPDERATPDAESTGIEVEPADEEADAEHVDCPEPGCDETFESVPGMKIHRTKIHLRDQSGDDATEATPAYRDPEALERAYEAHDSFPAMREALDVDVSPQTVRRHMIQHGIHDPSGDADEDDAGSEPADVEAEPAESEPEPTADVETEDSPDETDSTPAYRDPEALESAYEAHDSFPAMRDALDVDVSAQTVRRYTIEHGIHDPGGDDEEGEKSGDEKEAEGAASEPETASADPSSDEEVDTSEEETVDDEAEPTIPENTALADTLPAEVTTPADVTFAELKEAVRTADTLYHIQQQFDLGRGETRDLLEALDLLELVHGRVATKREREELKAEIDSRIRHSIRGNGTSA